VTGPRAEGGENISKVQLERQNERLKEALVRLRDVTTAQEAEMKGRISSLERELSQSNDSTGKL
jgi:dynactin 1